MKKMLLLLLAAVLAFTGNTQTMQCDTVYTTVNYDSAYTKIVRCRPRLRVKHTDSIRLDITCNIRTTFGALVQGGTTTLSQDLHNAKQYIPAGSFWRSRLFMDGPGATGISTDYAKCVDSGYNLGMIIKWGNSSNSNPVAFPTDMTDYGAKLALALSHMNVDSVTVTHIEDEETTNNHTGSMAQYLTECATAAPIIHAWGGKLTNGGIHPIGIGLLMYDDYIARGKPDSALLLKNRTFSNQMGNYVNNPASNPTLALYKRRVDTLLRGYAATGIDYVNMHWKEPFNGIGDGTHMIPGGYTEYFDFIKRITGLPVMCNEVGFNTDEGSPTALVEMMNEFTANHLVHILWFDDDEEGPGQGLMHNGVLTANGIAYRNWLLNY